MALTHTWDAYLVRPISHKKSDSLTAYWEDVSCQQRNLAVCQKPLVWTLQDAVDEIIQLRKELQAANNELLVIKRNLFTTNTKLTATNTKLVAVDKRVVPVGSIYIEYYGQPNPKTLWPALKWSDISNTYAGLFFRAIGGASASWGAKQSACAPRFTKLEHKDIPDNQPQSTSFPTSGWSPFSIVSRHKYNWDMLEPVRFYTEHCEVRPNNQAIRIWKRVA